MSLRVISGEAKGRRLKTPPGSDTRPTADRVRQTLFDILADVSGARVLDLFAGSGALGIEALSRGAAHATFVEDDAAAAQVVRDNLTLCRLASRATVRRADAETFLRRRPGASSRFDLVFLDPPYERGLAFIARLCEALVAGEWVEAGGRVVAETAVGALDAPPGFHSARTKIFGRTQLTIVVRDDVARKGIPEPDEPDADQ